MKVKNTFCIAEWQSFSVDEILKAIACHFEYSKKSQSDKADSINTKDTSFAGQVQYGKHKDKAQKIFDELVEFAKYESNHQFLKLIRQNGADRLKAQNYVGLIQTQSGFCVEILPKTFRTAKENEGFNAQDNKQTAIDSAKELLLNMLKTLKNSPFKESQLSTLKTQHYPLLEVFVNMFLDELETLIKKGLKSDYICLEENRKFLKGKLLFTQNLAFNFAHKERFFTNADEFDLNIAPNRLILSTLLFLNRQNFSPKTSTRINQSRFVFADISPSQNTDQDFAQCENSRLYKDYELILLWCKIFLKRQSFMPYQGDSKAFALLFDMNKLFESFVANEMKKWLCSAELSCENKEKFMKEIFRENKKDSYLKIQEKSKYLASEGNKNRFLLKPDIVGYQKQTQTDQAFFIADTKWKILSENERNDAISQADIYQIWAYLCKYQCQKGFLIYPYINETENSEIKIQSLFKEFQFKPQISFDEKVKHASLFICFFPLKIHKRA